MKISPQINLIMLNTFISCQNSANLTVLEIYAKKKSSIFNNGGHIFWRIKNPQFSSIFIPSSVRIGQVVSEENSFEKLLTMTTDDADEWR